MESKPKWREDVLSIVLVVAAACLGGLYWLEARSRTVVDEGLAAKQGLTIDGLPCESGATGLKSETLSFRCDAPLAQVIAGLNAIDANRFQTVAVVGTDARAICRFADEWVCDTRPNPTKSELEEAGRAARRTRN